MSRHRHRRRISEGRLLRRIIVLASEGRVTERRYFDELNKKLTNTNLKTVHRRSNRSHPEQVLEDLISFKEQYGENYPEGTTYWLVVDRDRRTFSEMNLIAEKAKKNSCCLVDSSPCFEVWLFQHFASIRDTKGFEGNAAHGGCKYVIEVLRSKYDSHYDKSKYNVEKYLKLIEAAVSNAMADDSSRDEYSDFDVGSRVYRLAQAIIDSSTQGLLH